METPVRVGDVARMVAAQVCFIGATVPAVVAGMLVRDRLDGDLLTATAVMTAVSAAAVGLGVALLSRRVRDGFVATIAATIVLCFVLYSLNLLWHWIDLNLGG